MNEDLNKRLIEGEDYEIDPISGYMIFTSRFHLKRGYCCGSGCRNCPYDGKKGTKEPRAPFKKDFEGG